MSAATELIDPVQFPAAAKPVWGALDGHLTAQQLERVLASMAEKLKLRSGPSPMVLDCRHMAGYDLDARHAFVDWNKLWRHQVSRVAIITQNRLYHVVIGAMSLASGQAMKGFAEEGEALAWATGA
ncbi:STAS/SEC14 domain-containing protein [Pseudenhygromyxa sp. WMMC2535]|uniref:STAS/SEC14 domain-containing protein n=1 Tax=Pseudenhygromyxa sp. WMMC2535 TaxID=2712867 RepID=UPI0015550329|nr:STAS/SEC14 domain-containing protein [Pseudenhygromyxa sp. WMMC2535]NVB38911.1 STAS/SEC14 domain-containing protein [Pseudenhygromyxa sp. WMMC2535]